MREIREGDEPSAITVYIEPVVFAPSITLLLGAAACAIIGVAFILRGNLL